MIFIHLYNDFSGSPRVLRDVIEEISSTGDILLVGSEGSGILDTIDKDLSIVKYRYFYFNNKYLRLASFICSQFNLFFTLLFMREARCQNEIYINTVLPFGAAIYGFLFRKSIIYHVHETNLSSPLLYSILLRIADKTAAKMIFVSKYCFTSSGSKFKTPNILYNSVGFSTSIETNPQQKLQSCGFKVIMVSSLKSYKGVIDFVQLAQSSCSDVHWTLILNAKKPEIDSFFLGFDLPSNLSILPKVDDPFMFMKQCDLLVNLSNPKYFVETFGLTLLEAMSVGVPVLGPTVGGHCEFVKDGYNGFLVDVTDHAAIYEKIYMLHSNQKLAEQLSIQALKTSALFSVNSFRQNLRLIIEQE